MAVIVSPELVEDVAGDLEGATQDGVYEIGTVEAGERGCTVNGTAGTWNSQDAWSATHRHG